MTTRSLGRPRTDADRSRAAGFTLIELLIVIVIIGILAGITLFAIGQFKSDSQTACSNTNDRINETVSGAAAADNSGSYTVSTGSC